MFYLVNSIRFLKAIVRPKFYLLNDGIVKAELASMVLVDHHRVGVGVPLR
jgi:hypothetical protein